MQAFCQKICLDKDIYESPEIRVTVRLEPTGEIEFFSSVGRETSKPAYDRLARGPRQRSDRLVRKFQDETEGDIYVAVLKALSEIGAESQIKYEQIRAGLRNVLVDEVPQLHEIGRVLIKMTEIARDQIDGEPVLDWDEENKVLHVVDPFFAFYLKWAPD